MNEPPENPPESPRKKPPDGFGKGIFVGTKNPGKLKEYLELFRGLNVKLLDASEASLKLLGISRLPEPEDNGRTFFENAKIKARHYADLVGMPALSDDSGIEVMALNGAPGVLSDRYGASSAGVLTPSERNALLLKEMTGVLDRRARMAVCCVLAKPGSDEVLSWEAETRGLIAEEPKGYGGFGYDPVFFVPALGRTMAELDPAEKNGISHRGRAARLMLSDAEKILGFLGDLI
jgi:XTP/dITP diphosphohydrolase